ncbi:UNVERIFIED_CONTAM: hypothetical protein QUG70_17465, partial [Acinetobacter lwoffii]
HSNSIRTADDVVKSESNSLSTSEQQSTSQSESTSYTTSKSQVSTTNNNTESQSSPLGHPEPKEEKKGFFARLFNL